TISPLASLDEPDSLKRLSKMISDLLPPVDLTLYCCSLIIHLCGAKKNKIHRNPGHCHVRLPLPDSFADGSQRSNGGADG
ncbi:hypothetical protein, partial [Klebsiella pneumoniae]|uniref:hypothetical protein n=1 Tax=Klebsiella pneumoniae TaxID=573 RepID=UPI001C6F94DA